MALRDIVYDDDPQLRKKSRAVTAFDSKLHKLLDDMLETMDKYEGVGLAAPQVGILRRVAIIRNEEQNVVELINPEILESVGEQICSEGCLSVKDRRHKVSRPMSIKVKAYDRNGEEFMLDYTGFNAEVVSHEVDHLDGILFYDRIVECDDDEEEIDYEDEDIDEEITEIE